MTNDIFIFNTYYANLAKYLLYKLKLAITKQKYYTSRFPCFTVLSRNKNSKNHTQCQNHKPQYYHYSLQIYHLNAEICSTTGVKCTKNV